MWRHAEVSLRLPPPDALLSRTLPWAISLSASRWPEPVRWRETADAYHLETELPGFRKKDVTVDVRGQVVEVRADRERGLFRPERRRYRHVVTLPEGADAGDVTARFAEERLSVRVGKVPAARRRTIPIRVNGELAPAAKLALSQRSGRLREELGHACRALAARLRSLFRGHLRLGSAGARERR